MGKNDKTLNRKRGRSVKGKRALEKTKFTRGAKYSLVAALAVDGIVSKKVIKGAYDFEHFWDFIFDCLVLEMTPYPGPNSVMVLDNARIHHNEELRLRMEMFGLKVIFLPAYSPDYNPMILRLSKIFKPLPLASEVQLLGVLLSLFSISFTDGLLWCFNLNEHNIFCYH